MAKRKQGIVFGAAPRADLLPKRQRQELNHERTLPKLLLAIIASAAVSGLIWYAGSVPVSFADAKLLETQSETAQLTAELETYSELQTTIRGINARSDELQVLTSEEVFYIDLLDAVKSKLPAESEISSFSGQLIVADEASTTAGSFCTEGAVQVLLTIHTPTRVSAAELIEALSDIEGFVCAEAVDSVGAGGENGTAVTNIEVSFNESVRSDRFDGNGGGA